MWKGGSPHTLVLQRPMKGRSYIGRHSRFQKTLGYRVPSLWRATTHTISSSPSSLSTSPLPFLKMFDNYTSLATLGSITTTFMMVPLGSSLPTRCVLYISPHIQICVLTIAHVHEHTHTYIYPCIHTYKHVIQTHTHTHKIYLRCIRLETTSMPIPSCQFH